MLKIKNWFCAVFGDAKRLFLNEPPKRISKQPNLIEDTKYNAVQNKLITSLDNETIKFIFLVGPWGSGKTTQIYSFVENYNKKHKDKYNFIQRSFFCIKSIDEAYLHLIGPIKKVILSLFFATIILFLLNYLPSLIPKHYYQLLKTSFSIIAVIFIYVFITNKLRLFYIICNIIIKKNRIYILEDLDRSSMSEVEQRSFLSNLWEAKAKYVVSLGYYDEVQKNNIYEMASKLQGKIIKLPILSSVNYKIILEHCSLFPFEESQWLENFTPRQLIEFCERIEQQKLNELQVKISIINLFYNIIRDIFFTYDQSKSICSRQSCKTNISLTISNTKFTEVSAKSREVLLQFTSSIKKDVIRELYAIIDRSLSQSKTSNWFDTELMNIFSAELTTTFLNKLK